MKKKFVAIILATVMATSLVACGSGNSTADTKKETSVSAKDTKDKNDDTKKKDSKKTESEKKESDKKKEDDKAKESAKKDEKADDKKETAKADTANKDNSTQKPNNSANNNNSNNKPSVPSQPNTNNQTTTPTPQPTPEPEPQPEPTPEPEPQPEPEPEPPAHQHNYKTVSTTPGTCKQNGTVTKKCSCGDTITESAGKGSHSYQHVAEQSHTEYVTETYTEQVPNMVWVAYDVCNKCRTEFTHNGGGIMDHIMDVCGGGYSTYEKEIQDGYKTVTKERQVPKKVIDVAAHSECAHCGAWQ